MDPQTRALMKDKAITVWLKADLDVLVRRVGRKNTRPLLVGKDPKVVLQELMDRRYPIYAEADITVFTDDRPASAAVEAILAALGRRLQSAVG
jgi:shikimate kinase